VAVDADSLAAILSQADQRTLLRTLEKLAETPTESAGFILSQLRGHFAPKEEHRTVESFVYRAHRLDEAGHTESALDLIYDAADSLMRNGQFEQLDALIADAPIAFLSVDVLLAILTSTLPARSRLPSRANLFTTVEQILKRRGEYEEGLLAGLEN
jgi:hypothetical protein